MHPARSVVVDNTEHTLGKDVRRLLETGEGSDVTVVANDGREFPAHMLILFCRTPVFANMFQHNMKERNEKRVTINDLNSAEIEGFLEFIYTDEVSNINPIAAKLLSKSNEYDMPKLCLLYTSPSPRDS